MNSLSIHMHATTSGKKVVWQTSSIRTNLSAYHAWTHLLMVRFSAKNGNAGLYNYTSFGENRTESVLLCTEADKVVDWRVLLILCI